MDKRYRSWFFTYNNPEISPTSLISLLSDDRDTLKIVFQRERGESGTEHYQGVVQYRHQVAFKTLKALDPSIHWEPCKNLLAALKYCTKDDSRIDGPWTMGWNAPKPIWTVQLCDLNAFQQHAVNVAKEQPDKRSIHWYWEQRGGVGKTALAKYAAVQLNALVLGGKSSDIKFGVAQWVRQRGGLGLAIFHFTRTNENFISYEAIEAIKDGIFYSSKYESGMVLYDCPTVICLANFMPDRSKLSEDRWKVWHIKDNGEGVEEWLLG